MAGQHHTISAMISSSSSNCHRYFHQNIIQFGNFVSWLLTPNYVNWQSFGWFSRNNDYFFSLFFRLIKLFPSVCWKSALISVWSPVKDCSCWIETSEKRTTNPDHNSVESFVFFCAWIVNFFCKIVVHFVNFVRPLSLWQPVIQNKSGRQMSHLWHFQNSSKMGKLPTSSSS